jgi:hypothetical protein
MPGAILHVGAQVTCSHTPPAPAIPPPPDARVTVGGLPVVTIDVQYAVAGCPNPPNAGGPCVTGQWTSGATRVKVLGRPVALQTGSSTCQPTLTPMIAREAQRRVIAI